MANTCHLKITVGIQALLCTKRNTETDIMSARGHETYTCVTENPELGLQDLKTNKVKCETCLEIFQIIIFFPFFFSYAENLGIQNVPKLDDKQVYTTLFQGTSRSIGILFCHTMMMGHFGYVDNHIHLVLAPSFAYSDCSCKGDNCLCLCII